MAIVQEKNCKAVMRKIIHHVSEHNRLARAKVADSFILKEYYYALGMIEATRTIGCCNINELSKAENNLYRPYE